MNENTRRSVRMIIALAMVMVVLVVLVGRVTPAMALHDGGGDPEHWCWTENYQPERCVPLFVPIRYPGSLDELYQFIESGEPGWTFDKPCQAGLPSISWAQVRMITAMAKDDQDIGRLVIDGWVLRVIMHGSGVRVSVGRVDVSEDRLFGLLLLQIGNVTVCGDAAGYPVMQGPGVQVIFDALGGGG